MSYTTLLASKGDGQELESVAEFRNSHGFAPMVWDILAQKYLKLPPFMVMSSNGALQRLFSDELSREMQPFEDVTLGITADAAYFHADNSACIAEYLGAFSAAHPTPGRVNHLAEMADAIRKLTAEGYVWFAVQSTSICDDFWEIREGADDDDEDPECRRVAIPDDLEAMRFKPHLVEA